MYVIFSVDQVFLLAALPLFVAAFIKTAMSLFLFTAYVDHYQHTIKKCVCNKIAFSSSLVKDSQI